MFAPHALKCQSSDKQHTLPVRAKALKLTRKFIKLLPLQGALLTVTIPRALPWAKSFCPFRAYLSHMRKFNK